LASGVLEPLPDQNLHPYNISSRIVMQGDFHVGPTKHEASMGTHFSGLDAVVIRVKFAGAAVNYRDRLIFRQIGIGF